MVFAVSGSVGIKLAVLPEYENVPAICAAPVMVNDACVIVAGFICSLKDVKFGFVIHVYFIFLKIAGQGQKKAVNIANNVLICPTEAWDKGGTAWDTVFVVFRQT